MTTGFNIVVPSLISDEILVEFPVSTETTEEVLKGLMVGFTFLGAFFGVLLCSFLADYFGRKMVTFVGSGMCLLMCITIVFSDNIYLYSVLRLFGGVGIGFLGTVCPLYIRETSPFEKRAGFAVIFKGFLNLGIVLAYVCGYLLEIQNWRILMGFGGFTPFILLFISYFGMTETSIHIYTKRNYSPLPLIKKFFYLKQLKKTIALTLLIVLQYFTGLEGVIYFGDTVYNFYDNGPIIQIGLGVWNMVTCFPIIYFSHRLPLFKSTIIFTSLMAISLSLISIFANDGLYPNFLFKAVGVTSSTMVYIVLHTLLSSTFWLLYVELFGAEETGFYFVNAISLIFQMISTTFFLLLFSSMDMYKTYLTFAIITIIAAIGLKIFLPFPPSQRSQSHSTIN
uniref:Major facilitator superfamily (MFS) profile domain-containing protein n=1 Tax=Arcella intermedia TaxID=1963864 RepID=A0A6B2L5R8_9EUKA